MTYTIVAGSAVEVTFRKMKTKDAARFEQVVKKLQEIGKPGDRKATPPADAGTVARSYRALCPHL